MIRTFKTFIIIIVSICLIFTYSFKENTNESSRILWSENYKLKWEDFQGRPDPLRTELEESATKTRIEVITKINKSNIEYQVPCYFEKNKSWTIGNSSQLLLNHEQLHFDIAEIYARNLRKKLLEIKFVSSKDIEIKVKELYHDVISASIDFQNKYDNETNHSKNLDQQVKWNDQIREILKSTNNYKSVRIVVNK